MRLTPMCADALGALGAAARGCLRRTPTPSRRRSRRRLVRWVAGWAPCYGPASVAAILAAAEDRSRTAKL